MNTCIVCCANRSRVHTLSSLSRKLHLLFLRDPFLFSVPFTLPARSLSSRFSLRSIASPSSLVRRRGGGKGNRNRRALFIQLPYLNVLLTRRKIICKNPHKICKSPLMHREIVALYRRAYGIVILLRRFISHHRSLVAKKGVRFGSRVKFNALFFMHFLYAISYNG